MTHSALFFVVGSILWYNSFAFIGPALTKGKNAVKGMNGLKAVPVNEIDLSAMSDFLHQSSDFLHQSSIFVADATDAVIDNAKNDGGWWKSWLNLFRNTLVGVHSVIDEPLRSVGIEQTWGPSIFLFTAGVRSLLIPLSIQQTKSAEYMRALKPYQDEIKEKFGDKKELMNRATAKLFEDAGQNPLSGCLISILQLPIFLGLYRGITLLAKEDKLNEPFLWIPSLEGPVGPPDYRGMEWLTSGWVDGHPALGWETTLAFLVMPVVLVLGQSLTMKVLTPESDTSNMSAEEKDQFEQSQTAIKFLPLLIGYFSLQVPAGLTIYWLTSNIFTLGQSLIVKSYYKANPPKIELPDYWDALDDVANMSPEERRKAAEAGLQAGPSLEDLVDEARFHYVVPRKPLRSQSQAWERVVENGPAVPSEMESWVGTNQEVSEPSQPVLESAEAQV